jgi:glutathione S-transferase
MLGDDAPRTAALSRRLAKTPALAALAEKAKRDYGDDEYCGGQIGASLRKVAG